MTRPRAPNAAGDSALLELIRAIVAGEIGPLASLLERTPDLARRALIGGASRAEAAAHYWQEIEHYTYAGDTALHVAAAAYGLSAAKLLISKGADVGARNRRGAEPLHYAADGAPTLHTWNPRAQEAIVVLLVEGGANPNALDKSGVAPLHRAVRTRSTGAVRGLLEAGANPGLENKSGSTPMSLAEQTTGRGGSGAPEAKREQEEIVLLLRAALESKGRRSGRGTRKA